eukprot:TRINITY_DN23205_c0_g1_i1.p1 TRINITY_DN23205_c0_g1~~TRINITY_DN23205_c0_g1_i1.p1  ORF type:complete len:245 (+),score=34.00 TRINITY_DN23205_c0_g1_i1:218-952(+)
MKKERMSVLEGKVYAVEVLGKLQKWQKAPVELVQLCEEAHQLCLWEDILSNVCQDLQVALTLGIETWQRFAKEFLPGGALSQCTDQRLANVGLSNCGAERLVGMLAHFKKTKGTIATESLKGIATYTSNNFHKSSDTISEGDWQQALAATRVYFSEKRRRLQIPVEVAQPEACLFEEPCLSLGQISQMTCAQLKHQIGLWQSKMQDRSIKKTGRRDELILRVNKLILAHCAISPEQQQILTGLA